MATARCISLSLSLSLSVLDINSNLASCLFKRGRPLPARRTFFFNLNSVPCAMCGQFSLLSLYFYLINFIARHRQAGNYRGTPRCPHAKPLPVVACRSRSRRRFSTLTMTYCRSQAKAQHSPSWDRQGTDKAQSRRPLSVCLLHWQFFSQSGLSCSLQLQLQLQRGLPSVRMWPNIACKSIHFARTQVEPAAAKVT